MSVKTISLDFCKKSCTDQYRAKNNGEYPPCACGTGHKMLPFETFIVHWNKKHWVIDCLTLHLLKEREKEKKDIALLRTRMKKYQNDLSSLICTSCHNVVGKKYKLIGNAVYCNQCNNTLGGEG